MPNGGLHDNFSDLYQSEIHWLKRKVKELKRKNRRLKRKLKRARRKRRGD